MTLPGGKVYQKREFNEPTGVTVFYFLIYFLCKNKTSRTFDLHAEWYSFNLYQRCRRMDHALPSVTLATAVSKCLTPAGNDWSCSVREVRNEASSFSRNASSWTIKDSSLWVIVAMAGFRFSDQMATLYVRSVPKAPLPVSSIGFLDWP